MATIETRRRRWFRRVLRWGWAGFRWGCVVLVVGALIGAMVVAGINRSGNRAVARLHEDLDALGWRPAVVVETSAGAQRLLTDAWPNAWERVPELEADWDRPGNVVWSPARLDAAASIIDELAWGWALSEAAHAVPAEMRVGGASLWTPLMRRSRSLPSRVSAVIDWYAWRAEEAASRGNAADAWRWHARRLDLADALMRSDGRIARGRGLGVLDHVLRDVQRLLALVEADAASLDAWAVRLDASMALVDAIRWSRDRVVDDAGHAYHVAEYTNLREAESMAVLFTSGVPVVVGGRDPVVNYRHEGPLPMAWRYRASRSVLNWCPGWHQRMFVRGLREDMERLQAWEAVAGDPAGLADALQGVETMDANLIRNGLRVAVRHALTGVALDAERYRLEHGGWPDADTLGDDPLGRAWRLRPTDDGVVVYSVGLGGVDDAGRNRNDRSRFDVREDARAAADIDAFGADFTQLDEQFSDADDIAFRLYDPAARAVPARDGR